MKKMQTKENDGRVRPTLRVEPRTVQRIEQWYKADNCRSANELMEKAINFYIDYLELNNKNDLLPKAVQIYLDGRIGKLEDRLRAISFQALVGLDEVTGVIADSFEFNEADLRRRRKVSVKNVKETNGFISLDKRARMSGEYDMDEEDKWQD